jgi:DNA-binding CsgD family transcriptional regulator
MPDIENLSEREREILYLVATGVSNKQIAQALHISTNTVKVHLRNIFTKIEVTSRTEAAMFAVSSGLVDPAGGTRTAGSNGLPQEDFSGVQSGDLQPALPGDSASRRTWSRWYFLVGILLALTLGVYAVLASRSPAVDIPATVTQAAPTPLPRWQEGAPLPTARLGLAVTAYENLIYAIAGEGEMGVTGMLECYDPEENSWKSLTPKPVPVTEVGAVVIGGKIYAPGGRTASGSLTNVLEIYDPREDRWEKGPPLPQPVSGYAATAFEGKLYLFGGWDGQSVLNTVYEFDPDRYEWRTLTPMPTARSFAGAAVSNGKIFVFGGFDGENPLAVNEIYQPDLEDGQGEPAWMEGPPMPEPRFGMGVASVADIIHVFGGLGAGDDPLPPLEYPPQTLIWQAFESPLEESWTFLGMAPSGTRLYLMGGAVEGEPSGRNLAYQAIYIVSLPVIR